MSAQYGACDRAITSHGHNALAMPVRWEGETLTQLQMRLDAAIAYAYAYAKDVFTDEANSPTKAPVDSDHQT